MKKTVFRFLPILVILCLNLMPAFGQDTNGRTRFFEVGIGAGYLFGHTLYQIGDYWKSDGGTADIPFEISQLKYTISDPVLTVRMTFRELFPGWDLETILQASLPFIGGTLEDSDWGYWYLNGFSWANNNTLDIYSTSDTFKEICGASALFARKVWETEILSLKLVTGLEIRYCYFESRNLVQTYPSYSRYSGYLSPSYSQPDTYADVGIRYHLGEFSFPLLNQLDFTWDPFRVKFGGGVLFGFFLDSDDHLLRSKLSTGSGFLLGGRASLKAEYRLTADLSLSLNISWDDLVGSGEQVQTRYKDTSEGAAGSIGRIGERIETMILKGGLEACWLF